MYFSDCLRLRLALVIFILNNNFNDFLDFYSIFSEALGSYLITGKSTVLIILNLYYILVGNRRRGKDSWICILKS